MAELLENTTSPSSATQVLAEPGEHIVEVQSAANSADEGDVLQAFVDARKRAALFLLIPEGSLDWEHSLQIRYALEGKNFEDLDLVIHSGGGRIAAAYIIIRMLRSHTKKKLNACVPVAAMSAATLLCLGADAIILDDQANIGPLDTQIRVAGKIDYKSALNPFKSLGELTTFADNTVFNLVKDLLNKTDLAVSDAFQLATQFVGTVNSSLLTKLDSEKLGEYRLALSEGEKYGERVLTQLAKWPQEKAEEVAKKLVYEYPSHNYVIDYYELRDLGFQVEFFEGEKERAAVIDLIKSLRDKNTRVGSQTTIRLVEPSGGP